MIEITIAFSVPQFRYDRDKKIINHTIITSETPAFFIASIQSSQQ